MVKLLKLAHCISIPRGILITSYCLMVINFLFYKIVRCCFTLLCITHSPLNSTKSLLLLHLRFALLFFFFAAVRGVVGALRVFLCFFHAACWRTRPRSSMADSTFQKTFSSSSFFVGSGSLFRFRFRFRFRFNSIKSPQTNSVQA